MATEIRCLVTVYETHGSEDMHAESLGIDSCPNRTFVRLRREGLDITVAASDLLEAVQRAGR